MPMLHMETGAVQSLAMQFDLAAGRMRETFALANAKVQSLMGVWQGESSQVFSAEFQQILRTLSQIVVDGERLSQRLSSEAAEWIEVDSSFGFGTEGAGGSSLAGGRHVEVSGSVTEPGAVEPAYRMDADSLLAYEPYYAGSELGDTMRDLNAFLAQSLGSDPPAYPVDLIKRLADLRGMNYEEAERQYTRMLRLMEGAGMTRVEDLSFLATSHWGSRRQLLFGKIVGDSLGLDPIFGAMLHPSGGLIGPGGGTKAAVLDTALHGVIDQNAWDYHAAAHDASGYLHSRYGIGPGYNYVQLPDELASFRLDTNSPLAGQVSGYLFWVQKLGISPEDFLEAMIKGGILAVPFAM